MSNPEWAKWLPAEAVAAIDRWWKPLWDQIRLLPERQPTPGELEFEAVEEPVPGAAWRARFEAMWPTYQAWYLQEGDAARPTYAACRRALEEHMPELMRVYERLVELAGGGDLAARLLSLYRPPGFIVGCSQGAWTRGEPLLVRNYDYPADRLEGIVDLTHWGERRVIGMSDCLWGLLDGMNDRGLAVSLTFGGRPDVGDGFAVPLVVRYLLETCDDVARRARRPGTHPGPCAAEPHAARPDRRLRHRLRRARPRAAVRRHAGHHQPPGRGRVAGVRRGDPQRGARALRARAAARRTATASRTPSSSRRCTAPRTSAGSAPSTRRRTSPRAGVVRYRWPDLTWEQSFERFEPGSRTVRLS